ncbi:MAG: peptidylprolyl isomerase [Clostridiales bacterium]|nr:peptidylprolyl isomerase [Clostridiales bacterium]
MKKIVSLLLILVMLVPFTCACSEEPAGSEGGGTHHVEMTFDGYGTITLELYGDIAPITVSHFIDLAKSGYYNGTVISRVQAGFVIQGGQGAGTNQIKGEFSANGVDNKISHLKGVISMARQPAYDTASDQFFISIDDACASSCDGLYAAFGVVKSGMDVIDKMVNDVISNEDYLYYYYYNMGFLPEDSQVKISSVKVID